MMTMTTIEAVNAQYNLDTRWSRALEFYRRRSPVVFLSPEISFWERHGFVQQSLARLLIENGIEVRWIDGSGWRKQSHVVNQSSPLLHVKQLRRLPGRRFPPLASLSTQWEIAQLKRLYRTGKRPFIWVYGGLDDQIAEALPYIDVFSVFDDPYCHQIRDPLCQKSKTILVQNSFTAKLFDTSKSNCHLLYPPTETDSISDSLTAFSLPNHMPQRAMGYIGTFDPRGFDFVMFEQFIRHLPDWTLVLCGRTNPVGAALVRQLQKYPNFLYLPWRPRNELGAVWRQLDVSLLLYRPSSPSHGAFPVKIIDSLHHGVPVVATAVPKTIDLEGYFPRKSSAADLVRAAVEIAQLPKASWQSTYDHFKFQMDPKLHLIHTSEWTEKDRSAQS